MQRDTGHDTPVGWHTCRGDTPVGTRDTGPPWNVTPAMTLGVIPPWAPRVHHRHHRRGDTAPMTDTPSPAYVTLGEAVKAVKASRSTLQRRLKAGEIPGAYTDSAGVWRIPYSGLITAGLAPRTTPADTPDVVGTATPSTVHLEEMAAEVARLRAENEHLAQIAEERATTVALLAGVVERLTEAISSGPGELPPAADPPPARDGHGPSTTATMRRRWWARRGGDK